jgi:hypothetical protein
METKRIEDTIQKLELKIQQMKDKIEELEIRCHYIEQEWFYYEEDVLDTRYWMGRWVATLCDLVNSNEVDKNKNDKK